MKIACLSLVEIFPDYVLGGSQNILRKIILGLRENNINVRLFTPKNDNPKSFIGDVEIENNYYPSRLVPSRLKPIAYRSNPKNLMRDLLERNKKITNHQDQD